MLTFLFFGLFFCLGAIVGSFLAHLIHSLVSGKTFKLWGRSSCDHCNKLLSTVELIPILGFLFKKGICPGCKKRINKLYPFVELSTALLFGIASLYFMNSSVFFDTPYVPVLFFIFLAIVLYTSATDLLIKAFSIRPLIAGIVLSVVSCVFLNYPTNWLDSISALGIGLGFFALIALFGYLWKKTTVIGEGDFYLIAFLCSTLGVANSIIALYIAILLGAIIGGIILVYNKARILAFAPFLSIGWFIAYFHGKELINVYLSFF